LRAVAYLVPTFWTRGSGKKLRGQPEAQTLALYLMTAPASNMIGLYYQPLPTILHETGLTAEEFVEAMLRVSTAEIAYYDEDACMVWVPESAKYQIGETLKPNDKRRAAVERELEMAGDHRFAAAFLERYAAPYGLEAPEPEGLPQTTEAPSEGHPRDEKPRSPSLPSPNSGSVSDPDPDQPDRSDLPGRAQLWLDDPQRASLVAPQPERWPEVRALSERCAVLFKRRAVEFPRTPNDPRCRVVLARLAEGYDVDRLMLALEGASRDEHYQRSPQFQNLAQVLRDAAQVDRFCALAEAPADTTPRSGQQRGPGPKPSSFDVAKARIERHQENERRQAQEETHAAK
jgi:hypothetical protein